MPFSDNEGSADEEEVRVRPSISLAYIGTRLRELEIIPYMVQTYA